MGVIIMNEINNYLVIKLGNAVNVDFYKEHSEIIKREGFVDFLLTTKRIPNFATYNQTFFIKESKPQGGRIFSATIVEQLNSGEFYPDYYSTFAKRSGVWLRINNLEVINAEEFFDGYESKSGKPLKSVFLSSTPFFGVRKK